MGKKHASQYANFGSLQSNSCQQNYFLPVLIESFDNKRLMKVVFTNKYPPIHYLNKISKGP